MMSALSDQILLDEKVPGPSEKRRAAIQHHSSTGRNTTMILIFSVSLTLGRG
ncbi:hypothetical protein WN51_14686 [Melipona quadrifasciata]|uniref:Uncharacterized protein n=1 Tax=Melipona quadrifasciata TaxID=166423 RepID=A0A0N0BGL7_9HYME|nr:hypothetical protein WN51_14686 [Melipona quadrifasciata]